MRPLHAPVHALAAVLLAPLAAAQQFEHVRGMVPRDAFTSYAVAAGDLDGDGHPDALAAGFAGDVLYLNDGFGVLSIAEGAVPPASGSADVALGDVDGDGDLDAVVGRYGPDVLLTNDGGGVFTSATLAPVSSSTDSADLADLNGDGHLDALLSDADVLRLFLGDGAGGFTEAVGALPPVFVLEWIMDVAIGDVDGDGDPDLLVGVGDGEDDDFLLLNDGSGTFTEDPEALPNVIPRDTRDVELVDVDADGDLDAVAANATSPDDLWINDGSGSFSVADPPIPSGPGSFSESLAAGDVDGDGDLDLFFGRGDEHGLLLNDGSGVFADGSGDLPPFLQSARDVELADMDADGDLDAVLVGSSRNRLYLGDGAGGFVDTPPGMPDEASHHQVELADVEGDGDLDVLMLTYGSGAWINFYRNDGSGSLADVPLGLPAFSAGAIAAGELDGDGDVDVFAANGTCFGGFNQLLLGDGTGGFAPTGGAGMPAPVARTEAVALGDVDGDGDLDALLGNEKLCGAFDARNFLFENDGSGVFTDATGQLPFDADDTHAVLFVDLDGDGDLDVLLGNGDPSLSVGHQADRLYVNDGEGEFRDFSNLLPASEQVTTSVVAGDVDGDGFLDVLFGNQEPFSQGAPNVLLLGQDGLGFADASDQLPPSSAATESLAMDDFDGDGDLDVWNGNYGQDELWLNDGAGSFADHGGVPAENQFAASVAAADLDDDGDLDVVLAGPSHVLYDVSRQLARRELPRLGKPLHLDLFGGAGDPWGLLFALGPASIPLPPYGTLKLDLATLEVGGVGALDAAGRGGAVFQVPDAPALAGLAVHWQAALGPALELTNLEITTLTVF